MPGLAWGIIITIQGHCSDSGPESGYLPDEPRPKATDIEMFRFLCHRGDGRGNDRDLNLGGDLAVGILLRAIARDVASFTALVASLSGSV